MVEQPTIFSKRFRLPERQDIFKQQVTRVNQQGEEQWHNAGCTDRPPQLESEFPVQEAHERRTSFSYPGAVSK